MIVDANFHLEICHFLLCACAGRLSGIGDLLHHAFELAVAVSVDFHAGFVAELDVDHIVLVHINNSLHVGEIGHAHYFRAGKLPRSNQAFTELAVQNSDRSVQRRINRGLGELIARLTRACLRAFDFVHRTFVSVFSHVISCLRRVVFLL